MKKNGKRCNAFVLKGRSDGVCNKHLEMAVATRQRSRMELATAYVLLELTLVHLLSPLNPQMPRVPSLEAALARECLDEVI